jgi:carboxynorspermidine decarboxylase
MLYSIKALPFQPVLALLAPWMDGFAVSSLFEARLAAPLGKPLHITTPGLRLAETAEIGGLCRFVAFNSLQQFHRLHGLLGGRSSPGLRVNPGLSFLDDRRYDPCREASKLGVPLDELARALAADQALGRQIRGLHFHTVFSSRSFEPMRQAAALIEQCLGEAFLSGLDWINVGGGYLFESLEDLGGLLETAVDLRRRVGAEVYFEPGKALAGRAGYLAATVIDRFQRDGKTVAVLDSTVNHHPEIFEYQTRPEPAWAEPERGESAILAGCTCLAGDVFGEYRFERLPEMGERLAFANVGAYSLAKANRFNGHNLPAIYAWDGAAGLRLMKSHGFEDYLAQWQADGPRRSAI